MNQLSHDFTLEKYQELCTTLLNCGYATLTVCAYLEQRHNRGMNLHHFAIMRHDIDRKIGNALRMAELEHAMGIHSTYYFRYPSTFRPDIIREIDALGHEIGYHYEVLSKAKGDPEKAILLFKQELCDMREVCEIKTICMHGNPMSRYDDRDLWNHYDFRDFRIDGEAYLTLQDAGLQYFTDTGRSWNGKHSVRDVMPGATATLYQVGTTDDLIKWIGSATKECLYLTIHPERWAANEKERIAQSILDLIINSGKIIISRGSKWN